MAMLRRIRSRYLCWLGMALLVGVAMLMLGRVLTLSRSEDLSVEPAEARQLRNPLATDFSGADASPELSRQLVRELQRIKKSVKKELVKLEAKRSQRLKELDSYAKELARTRAALSRSASEMQQMHLNVASLQARQAEIEHRNLPLLQAPLLSPALSLPASPPALVLPLRRDCSVHSCFDYRPCGLAGPVLASLPAHGDLALLRAALRLSPFSEARAGGSACLHIRLAAADCPADGRNCLLLDPHANSSAGNDFRGMLASPVLTRHLHQPVFDVVLPAPALWRAGEVWSHLQPLLPAHRPLLLSFVGLPPPHDLQLARALARLANAARCHLRLACNDSRQPADDWRLCGSARERLQVLRRSTFALIVAPPGRAGLLSSMGFQRRLYEALVAGAVPVVVGEAEMPLAEAVDWSRCVIRLARQRATEVHFLLRTIPEPDIVEMRRRGRAAVEAHLGSAERQLASALSVVGARIGLPKKPVADFPAVSAFQEAGFKPETYEVENQFADIDDYMGPVDKPQDSVAFQRNFSAAWTDAGAAAIADPFLRYPFSPWAPLLPTEAQFRAASSYGYRPIDHAAGGAGIEFSKSLGSNVPYEQYTAVLLTYKRENVLMTTLAAFKGVPYLHSLIVVWNAPEPPSPQLKWPKLQVPVHVVRGRGNSLNNRFLPFDLIKTEAVLSVDDDVQLRQDEIVFGFRVWREQRHRLVGFPARFHQWSPASRSWVYNSNHTCEYSMILTGAAFFHKYYAYLYSYVMPAVVRSYVDRVMNCEDLAMNFLVSHVTRQPPVKVTSRWTFRCQMCSDSLYLDRSHYVERNACLNFLTDVYGYNPLLYSQFRLDSVLFKTRIPADKRKCFKYV